MDKKERTGYFKFLEGKGFSTEFENGLLKLTC